MSDWQKLSESYPNNEEIVLLLVKEERLNIVKDGENKNAVIPEDKYSVTLGFYTTGKHWLRRDNSILNYYRISYREKSSVLEPESNGNDYRIKQGWFEITGYSETAAPIDTTKPSTEVVAWCYIPEIPKWWCKNGSVE